MELTAPDLRWIVLLPLLGAAFNGLIGKRVPRTWVSVVGVCAPAFAFVITLEAFLRLKALPPGTVLSDELYTWIAVGGLTVPVKFDFDALSAVMALVVTGVGSLIHLYSVGYMASDPGYHRYFAYLNLFMFAMLTLVLGSSLPILFVGWEGVGLCSYLLIGFWFSDRAKAAAGMKAFVVNRIGDFGFLIALFLLFRQFGTLDIAGLAAADIAGAPSAVITIACLMLFVGACGKSAQIPLYTWLPDAMAGPTPVSALIHAATMVTAGVYMVCRLGFLYVNAPVAMAVVASVGALTALFAATIGLTQNDIKKVLAYSTVSQLGFMFIAAGVGAFSAAIFHLVTHAFFKACLFLGSGSVIHAMDHAQRDAGVHGDPQDIRRMGGLGRAMPLTALTFGASTIAIAGFPLTAGFFSKDEILWRAFSNAHPGAPEALSWLPVALYGVGLLAALLTAIYMGRCFLLTFSGRCRTEELEGKVHESPLSMTLPLLVLGFLALAAGFLGVPHTFGEHTPLHMVNHIDTWLAPILGGAASAVSLRPGVEAGWEWGLTWLSAGVGVGGLALAFALWFRGRSELPARVAAGLGGVYRLVLHKYRIDELYDRVIVRPLIVGSEWVLHKLVDRLIIDTLLLGIPVQLVKGTGALLRRIQSGNVQWYATVITLGLAAIVAAWAFGGVS